MRLETGMDVIGNVVRTSGREGKQRTFNKRQVVRHDEGLEAGRTEEQMSSSSGLIVS